MKAAARLWRIAVTTSPQAEDAVAELLASTLGAPAAAYFDLESQASTVSVFLEEGQFLPAVARREIAAGLERLRACDLPVHPATLAIGRIKRENWAESWKKHFHPIEISIGRGRSRSRPLLIKPPWSKRRALKHQAVVVLDPGLSFGTGHHPTTAFCLHQIARCLKSGASQSLLDIGTGSGILAIAAAKLGYQPVHAFDFDPEAVRIARENARKNRVDHKILLTRNDITQMPRRSAERYDVVCANLISDLLIAERERIIGRLKRGGTLVLAGILEKEFATVEKFFLQSGLKLAAHRAEKEWNSGAFCFV